MTGPTTCARCGHRAAAGLRFCTECGQPLAAAAPPPPPARTACLSCGRPFEAAGLRFCTHCGAPTSSAPRSATPSYGAPAAPWVDPRPPARRRVWPWVLVGLLLVALAGGGLGLVVRGGEDAAQPYDVAGPSEEPSASESGSESPVAAATVTCWDGSTPSTLEQCERPAGQAGLEWVYPSLVTQAQDCAPATGLHAPGRAFLMQCKVPLADGTLIRLDYSRWGSKTNAYEYYETTLGLAREEVGETYRYTGTAGGGRPIEARLFVAEPFSVAAFADTPAQAQEALDTLVVSRPADQVRGTAQ